MKSEVHLHLLITEKHIDGDGKVTYESRFLFVGKITANDAFLTENASSEETCRIEKMCSNHDRPTIFRNLG
jgi:hypothetical protein